MKRLGVPTDPLQALYAATSSWRTWLSNGYVWVLTPGGERVALHRLIAELSEGRLLGSEEVVHHIDGDKRNNRPENLEVVSSSEHALIHTSAQQRRRWDDFHDRQAAMLARRKAEEHSPTGTTERTP